MHFNSVSHATTNEVKTCRLHSAARQNVYVVIIGRLPGSAVLIARSRMAMRPWRSYCANSSPARTVPDTSKSPHPRHLNVFPSNVATVMSSAGISQTGHGSTSFGMICLPAAFFPQDRPVQKKQKTSTIQHGERGGTRTLDPMIKSHVLYRLSYALTRRAV